MPQSNPLSDYFALPESERAKIDVNQVPPLRDFFALPKDQQQIVADQLGFSLNGTIKKKEATSQNGAPSSKIAQPPSETVTTPISETKEEVPREPVSPLDKMFGGAGASEEKPTTLVEGFVEKYKPQQQKDLTSDELNAISKQLQFQTLKMKGFEPQVPAEQLKNEWEVDEDVQSIARFYFPLSNYRDDVAKYFWTVKQSNPERFATLKSKADQGELSQEEKFNIEQQVLGEKLNTIANDAEILEKRNEPEKYNEKAAAYNQALDEYKGIIKNYPKVAEEQAKQRQYELSKQPTSPALAPYQQMVGQFTEGINRLRNLPMRGVQGILTAGKNLGDAALELAGTDVSDYSAVDKIFDKAAEGLDFATARTQPKPFWNEDGSINTEEILPMVVEQVGIMGMIAAGASPTTKALQTAGLASKPAQFAGLTTSSYMLTVDEYMKNGLERGMSESEARGFATKSAAVQGFLESVNPNLKFLYGSKPILQGAEQLIKEGAKPTTKQLAKQYFSNIAREDLQETLQLAGDKMNEFVANETLGENYFNPAITKNEIVETVLITSLVTGLVGGGELRLEGQRADAARYSLAQMYRINPTQVTDAISTQQQAGNITEQAAKDITADIQKYAGTLSKIPQNFTDKQKSEVAPLVQEKQELEKQKESVDESFHPQIDEQIKAKDEQIQQIISPKPETKDAVQIEETAEGVLRDGGIRRESELQGVVEQDQPEGATEVSKEKTIGVDVGEEMRGNKLPSLNEVYEMVRNEHESQGNDFVGENGAFQTKAKAKEYVKEIRGIFDSLDDNVPIYRAVLADEVDLDPYGIGESWTFDLRAAKQFAKMNLSGENVKIIKAYVPRENIDFERSIRAYANFSDLTDADSEFEVYIQPNSKLLKVQVDDFKSAKELSPFTQPTAEKTIVDQLDFSELEDLIPKEDVPLAGAEEISQTQEITQPTAEETITEQPLVEEKQELVEEVAEEESISTMLRETQNMEVSEFMKGSKVVDENGNPIVVYHGTQRNFKDFELPSFFGKAKYSTEGGMEMGMAGKGIFFSSNPESASSYAELKRKGRGGNVRPVILNIKKAIVIDAQGKPWTGRIADSYKQALRIEGYDGVIIRNVRDNANNKKIIGDVYVVRSPSQIKSAIGLKITQPTAEKSQLIISPKTETNEKGISKESTGSTEEGQAEIPTQEEGVLNVPAESKPTEGVAKEQVTAPSLEEKSILNQETDLKGNKKEQWMFSEQENKDFYINRNKSKYTSYDKFDKPFINEKKISKKIIGEWELTRKINIGDAIKNNSFQRAISEGRMTANDAKTIIESAGLEVPQDILDAAAQKPSLEEKENVSDLPLTGAEKSTQPTAEKQLYKIGKSPQTYEIVEELPFDPNTDLEGEKAVRVRNTKTGREETVLETDLKPVKKRRSAEKVIDDTILNIQDFLDSGKGKGNVQGIIPSITRLEAEVLLKAFQAVKKLLQAKKTLEEAIEYVINKIKDLPDLSSKVDIEKLAAVMREQDYGKEKPRIKLQREQTKEVAEEVEPEEQTEEEKPSGIKKALVSDEVIQGVELDKISDTEMMNLGRKILDTGEVKPENIVRNIIRTGNGVLTPKEVVALITYKADLDNQLRNAYKEKNRLIEEGGDLGLVNEEISELESKVSDFDVMAVITANQQSMAFRLRKMMLDRDYNIVRQIEQYKANNGGYIPPEIEAKFRDLGRQLDEVKAKLADAEQQKELEEAQAAVENIKESVAREKQRGGFSEAQVQQRIREGVEAEITDIYSKLPKEKKRLADRAIAALEAFQDKIRSKGYSDVTGAVAIIDAGITTIKHAIKAGVAVADAVELGIKKIRQLFAQQGIKDWAKEDEFRKDMIDGFAAGKVDTKKTEEPKVTVGEDGSVKIPNKIIRGLVERGVTDINELVDSIHGDITEEFPNVSKRQVRDAITGYGKTANLTADEIQTEINKAKRVGKLLSELEDLQAGKDKKKGKKLLKISEKERELKRQIKVLSAEEITPEQVELKKKDTLKKRLNNRIEELQRKIQQKDFAKKPKPKTPVDKEINELAKKKEALQDEFDEVQYENELKNRNIWQKAEDAFVEILAGLPRALVASIDLGAVLIQGLKRLATSPIQSGKAFIEMFRQLASEQRQHDWMNNIRAQPWYPMLEASKLSLTEVGSKFNKREELFISDWINSIWNGIGKLVTLGHKPSYNVFKKLNPYKAASRAFTAYLNSIRVSAFLEGAKYLEKQGMTFESNPKEFQKWADYVNTTTGRGSLGAAEKSAKWLSIILFAPRKVIADLKLFTPYVFVYYARFPKAIRRKAVLDFAQAVGTIVTANILLYVARQGDDDDDKEDDNFLNPNSTDFLTHKFGDTRLDLTGGIRTNLVFMARMMSGKYTDQYGFTSNLGDRYGKLINSRQDLVENFVGNKFSPLVSLANKKLDERAGLEVDEGDLINAAIPMWTQDIKGLYKEHPDLLGVMLNALAIFGAGVRNIDDAVDSISVNGKKVKLTEEQQEFYGRTYTEKQQEVLEKLIDSDEYIDSTDEEKMELRQKVTETSKAYAEAELKKEYPELSEETEEEKERREAKEKKMEKIKEKGIFD